VASLNSNPPADENPAAERPAEAEQPVKRDGRKRRWEEHKIARRQELVQGTIDAIRTRGPEIGMDEIAHEIGVSKTVLYRYFNDKADLIHSTMRYFVEGVLAPRVQAAMTADMSEYELTRAAMRAYVDTVAQEPNLYLFVIVNSTSDASIVADSERTIAGLLAITIGERLRQLGMDSGGAMPWAYALVGACRMATHWWISEQSMPIDTFINYLTMLMWGGMSGIVEVGGSPAKFMAQDHSLPIKED
jgi:AcrR family transcriptional regulator